MKHKNVCLIAVFLCAAVAFALRIWNLIMGVDDQGLPISGHISVWLMALWCILFLAGFTLLAQPLKNRSSDHTALFGSRNLAIPAYAGAVLILVSAGGEFGSALVKGADIWSTILCLLGILSGVCLMAVAWMRSHSTAVYPPLELVPDTYLVLKLVLNFKSWSTDPIILDYCIMFFALTFVVLGFYYSTGYLFDQGKPRRSLVFAMAGCTFSIMALADGLVGKDITEITECLAFFLWLLPIISRLCDTPSSSPPSAEAT